MTLTLSVHALTSSADGWALSASPMSIPENFPVQAPAVFAMLQFVNPPVMAAYSKDTGLAQLYPIQPQSPWLGSPKSVNIGPGWEVINGLTFSNTNYLMAYESEKGKFAFFSLNDALGISGTYSFYRSHAPCASKGFSMVRPFALANGIIFMGYAFDTGAVAMYSLTGIVAAPPGSPPIGTAPVWDHVWAPGWTRFAFFALGGEVFFLKTNAKYNTVNIDHVLDAPASGTVEVGSNMNLADALALSIVEPFALGYADPHFVAYRPDGLATIYRIHSDCQNWTKLTSTQTAPGALAFMPASIGSPAQQLFFQLSES